MYPAISGMSLGQWDIDVDCPLGECRSLYHSEVVKKWGDIGRKKTGGSLSM
jgi:hypothetical protein